MSERTKKQAPTPSKTALPGRRVNAAAMDPFELVIVGRDTNDGPEHPLWQKRALNEPKEAMVQSIIEHGVLETVLVCKFDGIVYVMDGRQRIINAREASRRLQAAGADPIEVVCRLVRGPEEAMEVKALVANSHRQKDDPITMADAVLRSVNRGRSVRDIAIAIGRSEKRVHELLKLAEAPEEVRKAVADKQITAAAALAASTKPRKKQLTEAKKRRRKGRPKGPSKVTIERVAQVASASEQPPHPQFLLALDWVLGRVSARAAGLEPFVNGTPHPAAETKRLCEIHPASDTTGDDQ